MSRWKSFFLACAVALCVTPAHADSSLNRLLFGRPTPPTGTGDSEILRAPARWPDPPALPARPAQPQIIEESKGPETVTTTVDGMEVISKIVDGQETVIKHVVRGNFGGSVVANALYWALVASNGGEVEIRGPCISACTLAASVIPKEKLCFDANGYLAFHKVRHLNKDGSTSPELMLTKGMVDSYPKDIRAWINAKGGYKKMRINSFWILLAPELWTMGYRKCANASIVNAIAKPANGTCPFGWTASGSYCLLQPGLVPPAATTSRMPLSPPR